MSTNAPNDASASRAWPRQKCLRTCAWNRVQNFLAFSLLSAMGISACSAYHPQAQSSQSETLSPQIQPSPTAITSPKVKPQASQANAASLLYGIDLSHYQGQVDWPKIEAQDLAFVFIKATQGRHTVDKEFHRNWSQSGEGSLLRGAYHYLDPSIDANAQAAHFINTLKGDIGNFPPVVDIESFERQNAAEVIEVLDTYVTAIEKYYGCKPIIYTSPGFWNDLHNHQYGAYPLWLADYSKTAKLPSGWESWLFWQFESQAQIPGVEGAVDKSRFAGKLEQLQALKCATTQSQN